MNGIMITLIIVFILDIVGSILEAKTFKAMNKEMWEIKKYLLSVSQSSPFPEFENEVKYNDERYGKGFEK